MYIICIESSKTRGMGHFFRSLLYVDFLQKVHRDFLILINNDHKAIEMLESKGIPYRLVDFSDDNDWVTPLIDEFQPTVWLQDKFETSRSLAMNIAKHNVLYCSIDEFGEGARYCDIHFAGMLYLTGHSAEGKRVYSGPEYVILNPDIDQYRRMRTKVSNVIVSLGGSDPYGMTVEVVKEICKTNLEVEIIIGPNFAYRHELDEANIKDYPVLQNVPSLIEEFSRFDFAITGGGVTCCEANACGIPCLIIANAPHEMKTGEFMQNAGGAVYGGSFEGINGELIRHILSLDIETMSRRGIKSFDTKAVERIFTIIEKETKL